MHFLILLDTIVFSDDKCHTCGPHNSATLIRRYGRLHSVNRGLRHE